ncbi:MAG TPA: hypothetical protein VGG27_02590 [Magnetospirillaceae bacterium]|jgi:hypothetical protein
MGASIRNFLIAAIVALACGPVTAALADDATCPGTTLPAPRVAPFIRTIQPAQGSNAAYDCLMWQTFIYLNWPGKANRRGVPNPKMEFGAPALAVWESFKTVDEVFLHSGDDPGPWDASLANRFADTLRSLVGNGVFHLLKQHSKVSDALKAPENPNSPQHDAKKTLLDDANQTDGGNLIDQNGEAVYYQMLMDKDEYNYIVLNRLYNANSQSTFARQHGIELPMGISAYGDLGAIEVKAAWKILGPGDDPARFHTAEALIGDPQQPVLVGLVGLHIVQHVAPLHQAVWATFAQIDNAPLATEPGTARHYSFFNARCSLKKCPTNTVTDGSKPTQVVQERPVPDDAARVNAFMQKMIADVAPRAPWQYYQLIDVQWPQAPEQLPKPPQAAPLPTGSPSTTRLLNPVLETYLQRYNQEISCLSCHQMARTAESTDQPFAADYSFLLSHARGLKQE